MCQRELVLLPMAADEKQSLSLGEWSRLLPLTRIAQVTADDGKSLPS